MKRIVLILSVLLAAASVAGAQDTIRYPDSCYMYNPLEFDSVYGCHVLGGQTIMGIGPSTYWAGAYEPDSDYLASNGYELVQDPLSGAMLWLKSGSYPTLGRYREYVASGQTMIYGIAATTGGLEWMFNCGKYLDSIYTLAELLNVSDITDSNFNPYAYLYAMSNGRTYCVDSVKWIRHNNPYRYFEYMQVAPRGQADWSPVVTYSYEFYFDKPVSVVDTFLIGVRFPYANNLARWYTNWWETGLQTTRPPRQYQNINDREPDLMHLIDFCSHHIQIPGTNWGGFFPILTQQDTTRCDPVREVQAIWATDTSVTLQWHGGNATQWEVEYAEADGMTAYTVTTTTPRVTLTGLRPTTTYLAHVRGRCAGETDYGEWSPFVEARTTAHQPDDTTQGPDTVKIDAVGLFTRLMPNPATSIVTVQSAYSLNHVELYDVQGRLVLELKAAGNAATFDVGSLPKGVYMVSVRTVAGTTTKRLLVE